MPGILVVCGGRTLAADVLERERRGYWAAALPLVLEKHGYLGFDIAGPEALERESTFTDYDVVLVGRLPGGSWTRAAARRARAAAGAVVVEGPLPEPLADELGVHATPAGRNGKVRLLSPQLAAQAATLGLPSGGMVSTGVERQLAHDRALDWERLGVPIAREVAEAWRAPGWDAEQWSVAPDAEVLAEWEADDGAGTWPAVVRRDGLVGCSFGLLTFLGQSHTASPFDGVTYRSWPRSEGLGSLLLGLVDAGTARAQGVRARILPWPAGADWVLSVRHEVAAGTHETSVRRALARHAADGTSATWYWRAADLGDDIVRTVARATGHEVALQVDRPWAGGEGDTAALEAATGERPLGVIPTNDRDCFRYQGAPNLLWAEREGYLYSEISSHVHLRPHRFAALRNSGAVEAADLLCLPRYELAAAQPADVLLARSALYIRSGGLLQVVEPPDAGSRSATAVLPHEGRLDWTAGEAARWWRRTHVRDALRLEGHEDGRYSVTATGDETVRGLVVELLDPSGGRSRFNLDLVPGRPVRVGAGGTRRAA